MHIPIVTNETQLFFFVKFPFKFESHFYVK